jgi:hypothetical protein
VGPTKIAKLPGASIDIPSTSQKLPSGASAQILFSNAVYDTDRMFDAANNGLVIHTPGKYLIDAAVDLGWTPKAGTFLELVVDRNGSSLALTRQPGDAGGEAGVNVSTIAELAAGDKITATVFQNTTMDATSFALAGGAVVAPRMEAQWLGP